MQDENQKRRAEILKQSLRAVVHLRAQLRSKRLGLLFGSGIGRDLKFPDWSQLVQRLADHKDVGAKGILDRFEKSTTRSLSSVTQLLFTIYRAKKIASLGTQHPLDFIEEQQIRSDWLKLLHTLLYAGVTVDQRAKLLKDHPYLNAFLDIMKRSKLTVNYNFDDTLERMLMASRDQEESNKSRGYETIAMPNSQFSRANAIIYHPNGYLPSEFFDGASSDVVFAEDAFQDQLIHAATGRYVHLSNHLMANTCLLVGLSLEDATLQSLLRQNAVSNPGNVHYIVHYVEKQDRDVEVEKTIFTTNFESFNLYTLFLDRQGIADLAYLISEDENSFDLEYPSDDKKYVYYVVGSVGAGKSTAAQNFRNLTTYDEWIDERKANLAVPESDVAAKKDREEIDRWVAEQFRKKNFSLSREKEGIHLVDRCPLDPLTFGEPSERKVKASRLIGEITHNGARPIEKGHIIYLDCDIQDVMHRNSLKHKFWPRSEFEKLMTEIQVVYGGVKHTKICTRGRSQDAVAKEIARVIFLGEYQPVAVQDELQRFADASPAGEASA